ncbi:hypothetical protein BDZ89DRAFT_466355 [Hymenopellis radicata]|nr:hypothetical protein BDZ89DRAFT_466355 [Hymenopellis radicata]
MVKSSAGMRENAANVDINWATEIVKCEAFEDCIRCAATTKRIRSRGDTLNAATFILDCYNIDSAFSNSRCYPIRNVSLESAQAYPPGTPL